MNHVLSVLVFLGLSNFANAAYMTPYEVEKADKCSKAVCFGNDGGASFLRYCEASSPSIIPGTIPVLGPLAGNGNNCFCPCTFEFLGGARR